jgi:hypothetical protein
MIIGLSGFAGSGKDSFYKISKELLSLNFKIDRCAFADILKSECDEFLIQNVGISSFTENREEKEIIRPFLVTYGTHVKRKINPMCWIDKLEAIMDPSDLTSKTKLRFITDVRYENEAQWVLDKKGFLISIDRDGVGPANSEEKNNSTILHSLCNYSFQWANYSNMNCDAVKGKVFNFWKKKGFIGE